MTAPTITPHRTKHPRQCDRCRSRAVWNVRFPGRTMEYVCEVHLPKPDPEQYA